MQKNCTNCGAPFTITPDDLKFYEKVSPIITGKRYDIPPPTHCPQCRYQRRLAFRNERTLYHRKCDLTGKAIISMHPANTPFPVYHITEWMSDKWDPKDYARDFDFSKPFFEQFQKFCEHIPHFSAFIDPHMDINSEYTNCASESKNCYLISQAEKNEDCFYARGINNCKNCCDCFRVTKCELCYEGIDLNGCFRCLYCQDCDNCNDCFFSTELRSCKNCFGCHSLIQKEYHIFNEPVSKEEWKEKVENLTLTYDVISQMMKRSEECRLALPQRATRQIQCENCIGDHISQCRESKYVFDSINLEYCAYCNEIANDAKYCQDYCMWGINCELLYECNGCGYNVYNTLFSNHCWQNITNLLYCESCFPSVKNCFGCAGLRRAEYCIFNKQYTKEEYEVLVSKIIEHMRSTGEYGEFFPIAISPYCYNESLANEFFPLSKEEVSKQNWGWREDDEKDSYLGPDVTLPKTVEDTSDDICDKILVCEESGKPYKISPHELRFYQRLGIPLPKRCPQQRHMDRRQKRNPRQLWNRTCDKCKKKIQTTYAPGKPEKIYCEECYLKTVY